jgi:hypothetical protein
MNLKSIILGLALVTATSTAALADHNTAPVASASASIKIGGSVTWGTDAKPVVIRDHRYPEYRDTSSNWNRRPRYEQPRIEISAPRVNAYGSTYMGGMQSARWGSSGKTSLPTRIENEREDFLFTGNTQRFSTLTLQAVAGSTSVAQVTIQFADHSTQVVRLDRALDSRNPVATIDLTGYRGRALSRVMVYGKSGYGAAYQLTVQ